VPHESQTKYLYSQCLRLSRRPCRNQQWSNTTNTTYPLAAPPADTGIATRWHVGEAGLAAFRKLAVPNLAMGAVTDLK
jgi:hypothetical protein